MRLAYGNNRKLKFYIGDVRRPESLLDAMTGVDFVFHAAALKQVPSCEFYPMEALLTNAVGAENVMNAAVAAGVKQRGRAQHRQGRLSHQRHGHLQGDDGEAGRGQVARGRRPRLHDQPSPATATSWPRAGRSFRSSSSRSRPAQPLTVTDPHMTRFMMSIDDAVDLVLYAFEHAQPGDLFVQKAPAATIETLALGHAAASSTPTTPSRSSARGTARSSTRRC